MNEFEENFQNSNDVKENFILSNFKFNGTMLGFIGYSILLHIGSALTFGILSIFLFAVFVRWCVENTTYKGKNLRFMGSCEELYVKFIIYLIISILTIITIIVPIILSVLYHYYVVKWVIENTVIE